jgi:hypothetical protein
MHHLQELNRKRFLNFQLLTPDEVIPPLQRTIVITKNSYKNLHNSNNFTPLITERPKRRNKTRALSSSLSRNSGNSVSHRKTTFAKAVVKNS